MGKAAISAPNGGIGRPKPGQKPQKSCRPGREITVCAGSLPYTSSARMMPPPQAGKSRLAYIDWMRGLACLLMFQTHCFDSWLSPAARQSRFFMYSQLGGTFPAPLFLFLAGISFALVTERLRQKNLSSSQIARSTIRRGAEILGFGLLLRLQEYVLAWGWSPRSDLLRVDILNTIGVSMMLMGVLCWLAAVGANKFCHSEHAQSAGEEPAFADAPSTARLARQGRDRAALVVSASATALTISLLTPLLWTTWRPRFLPWPLESYVDGVHNLGTPQAWLFPIFPWAAFAFAGLAVGFILQGPAAKGREASVFLSLGGAGIVLVELSRWLDGMRLHIYPVYDYWHTSPEFFLIRLGMLLMILAGSYAWCRWVIAKLAALRWGFSPLIQLGQASLLVYWVHIEFVYGRFSILRKHAQGIGSAAIGLAIIFVAMLALAYLRTHTKGWMKERMAQRFSAALSSSSSGGFGR